ncbi:MAG: transglycosylase domain-containing protein, partial [Synergistaceae bacterium]|nr:transglycosylase domain-containing protein [Synergistaceae bacterium]
MKKTFLIFGTIALLVVVVFCSIDINPDRVKIIYGSTAFYDANGKLFHVRLSPSSEWQIPITLDEMGKWLPIVAVNAEDGRFYWHFGIDFIAMARAVAQDFFRGRVV